MADADDGDSVEAATEAWMANAARLAVQADAIASQVSNGGTALR